jgi:hypothetical protein
VTRKKDSPTKLQDSKDQQLIGKYITLAKESFVEDANLTQFDCTNRLAFMMAIGQTREKLARLLAMLVSELAISEVRP